MKNVRVNFLIAFLLVGIACYFIFRNNFSTVREEDRSFAVEDTASVTKIFLADRNNHSVTLERRGPGEWVLNGKSETRQKGVALILDCLKKIRVQSRVPKNSYNTVVKELSTTGVKMEVYLNGSVRPDKVYFIGGSTQDVLGTYMMLENSSVPFITEVPGFNGYLTPRFSPVERDWLIPTVFDLKPEEIKSVSLEYANQPSKSFLIEREGGSFRVSSPVTREAVQQLDTFHVKTYLEGFKELNFETWDRHLNDKQVDSLRNTSPVSILTVTDTKGTTTKIPLYLKPVTPGSLSQNDPHGKPREFDIDRMYAFINGGKDLVTIQYFVFNRIFAALGDFDKNAPQRKIQQ